jgi:hypothetical protein
MRLIFTPPYLFGLRSVQKSRRESEEGPSMPLIAEMRGDP